MATAQQKAAQGVVVGVGALTGQTSPVPRYDIDVLISKNPDAVNLMLQAIALMQKDPGTLGFYGITGIHGYPTAPWDNVSNIFSETFGGYCAHGVLIFPTWHRPYLALYEQTIYLKMVEVANGYNQPHRQRYLDAAKQWRLPYFDYFRPRGGKVKFPGVVNPNDNTTSFDYDFRMPDIFNEKTLTIRIAPNDTPTTKDNPLYTYKFSAATGQLPDKDRRAIGTTFPTQQTVRYPASSNSTGHNLKSLTDALNSGREGRAAFMIALLTSSPYNDLETVATDEPRRLAEGDITDANTKTQGSGNLESTIHGNYHLLIGGTGGSGRSQVLGQMYNPVVAAFDPVFFFHHCNIDRLWMLWQALHPNNWYPKATATTAAENLKDLLPFYKTKTASGKGTFYNSDDARKTEPFGYWYDDFADVGGYDVAKLKAQLDTKYTWSTRVPTDPNFRPPPASMTPINIRATSQFFQPPSASATAVGPSVASNAPVTAKMVAVAQPALAGAQAVVAKVATTVTATVSSTVSAAFIPTKVNAKFDREWFVDCQVRRSAANGSFTIFFFLAKPGEITTNSADFLISPFLAGVTHVFAASAETCDNCGDIRAAGQLSTDTSNITALLLDYLDRTDNRLDSLRPEHVKPFLVKYLRWRVLYNGVNLHDPRDVPDFTVGVSAKVSHDDGPHTYEEYPDVVTQIIANASAPAAGTA